MTSDMKGVAQANAARAWAKRREAARGKAAKWESPRMDHARYLRDIDFDLRGWTAKLNSMLNIVAGCEVRVTSRTVRHEWMGHEREIVWRTVTVVPPLRLMSEEEEQAADRATAAAQWLSSLLYLHALHGGSVRVVGLGASLGLVSVAAAGPAVVTAGK